MRFVQGRPLRRQGGLRVRQRSGVRGGSALRRRAVRLRQHLLSQRLLQRERPAPRDLSRRAARRGRPAPLATRARTAARRPASAGVGAARPADPASAAWAAPASVMGRPAPTAAVRGGCVSTATRPPRAGRAETGATPARRVRRARMAVAAAAAAPRARTAAARVPAAIPRRSRPVAAAGELCVGCDARRADGCSASGACTCGGKDQCPAGTRCLNGACVCRPASCPSGCCHNGLCYAPAVSSCGSAGGACAMCDQVLADNCTTAGACGCGAGPACAPSSTACPGAASATPPLVPTVVAQGTPASRKRQRPVVRPGAPATTAGCAPTGARQLASAAAAPGRSVGMAPGARPEPASATEPRVRVDAVRAWSVSSAPIPQRAAPVAPPVRIAKAEPA